MNVHIEVTTALGRRKDIASLAYIVVDELESDFVGLTINAWPTLDDRRLRFDLERSRSVGSTKQGLHAFLARHRTPRKVADRAAPHRRRVRMQGSGSLSRRVRSPTPAGGWFPPITDISAEAREAAKLAFFSAVAPIANRRRDPEVVRLAPESTPLRSQRSVSRPDPFGS